MLDYFQVLDALSPEDRQVQSAARDFVEAEVKPRIRDWWEDGVFPRELVPKLGEMGFLGANLPQEYRIRQREEAPYIGSYEFRLKRIDGKLKIQHRRAVLDLEELRSHGALSIIF